MTTMTPSDVRIVTDAKSYQLTSSRRGCTGIVAWALGADYFPDDRWNDFVLVLACWWLSSVKQLDGSDCSAVFRFMDGPFSVECERTGTEVHGRFLDERRGRIIVSNWTQSYGSLREQIVSMARSVLLYCDGNQVSGRDVDELRSVLRTM